VEINSFHSSQSISLFSIFFITKSNQTQQQPMILSRRTSYKIANGSPRGHSPVVAMELKFDSPAPAMKKFKGSSSAKPLSNGPRR
jgi:hypothetical protein